jgi:hypothetical protein
VESVYESRGGIRGHWAGRRVCFDALKNPGVIPRSNKPMANHE